MGLSVELRSPRKGLINIKNKNQKCFYSVMLEKLILQKDIQKELKKLTKRVAQKLDYDEIEFPVQEKDLNKVECKNNI